MISGGSRGGAYPSLRNAPFYDSVCIVDGFVGVGSLDGNVVSAPKVVWG